MSAVPWPTAAFRVRSVLACTLGAALLASSQPSEQSRIGFENRQERSGVTFVLNNGTTDDKPIIDSTLGGVALLDYDNDGYLDLFFSNGASIPGLDKSKPAFSNRLYHNNRDGTFSEVSGALGLDFPEDSRSFVLADIDHDGRLELILKNRNAPQLRILHNGMKDIGASIAFRLRGTKSNRDAIGTCITVDTEKLSQTKYLQAGSGFLAQHSKEVFFGVGKPGGAIRVTIRWPSGLS